MKFSECLRRMLFFSFCCLMIPMTTMAQDREEAVSFGDMDQWIDRQIKESRIIGGAWKHVYAIGPTQVLKSNKPYENIGGSPWATSNVLAKVAGIIKTNTSVFPEERGDGFCARLDTRMESVKVMGLVDITVLAAGSIFLGTVNEPIRGTKDPYKILNIGIPFTQRPKAVKFDYKVKMADSPHRIRATGFSRIKDVEGIDYPVATLLLQKRWEDEDGNVFAKRVGTMVVRYEKTTEDWQNDARYDILYGNITSSPKYNPETMNLQTEDFYVTNSEGDCVPLHEIDWAEADETPTHIILKFTSSHGGAYIGSPGNSLWIDNVKLVY